MGKYKRGSSLSISKDDFFFEINQITNLTLDEKEILERAYLSRNDYNQIDYIMFCEDIKSANRMLDRKDLE